MSDSPPIQLKILETGYTLVPALWTKLILEGADKGIPASFWKYSLVLWRDVVGPNCVQKGFVAKKTMKDFGIRPATAMKWTAAYAASGFFKVVYGFRHDKDASGRPTVFQYLDATQEEWEVFIRCVADTIDQDKRKDNDPADVLGFRMWLTTSIIRERRQHSFAPVFQPETKAFLVDCERRGLLKLLDKVNLDFEILRHKDHDRLVRLKPGEYVEEQMGKDWNEP